MKTRRTLKYILPVVLLAGGGALVLRPKPLVGQPQTPVCTDWDYGYSGHRPSSLTYDTAGGLSVLMSVVSDPLMQPRNYTYTVTLARDVNGQPNPDFDRLYALLLKGVDSKRLSRICTQGAPVMNASLPLTAASLSLFTGNADTLQRVQICGGTGYNISCANVLNGVLSAR